VHLGGTLAEVARSEADVSAGRMPERRTAWWPSPAWGDPTRAPEGQHTLCGRTATSPRAARLDVSGMIEAQIERFAPGFRDLILAKSGAHRHDIERYNPELRGAVTSTAGPGRCGEDPAPAHPAVGNPYRTAIPGVYLCSSSTPPGRRRARHVRPECRRGVPWPITFHDPGQLTFMILVNHCAGAAAIDQDHGRSSGARPGGIRWGGSRTGWHRRCTTRSAPGCRAWWTKPVSSRHFSDSGFSSAPPLCGTQTWAPVPLQFVEVHGGASCWCRPHSRPGTCRAPAACYRWRPSTAGHRCRCRCRPAPG